MDTTIKESFDNYYLLNSHETRRNVGPGDIAVNNRDRIVELIKVIV